MKIYWTVAFRNMKRHWRQSTAAISSIAIGLIAMVLFDGYIEGMRQLQFHEYRERMMFGDINVEKLGLWDPPGRAEPWNFSLSEKDQSEIGDVLKGRSDVEAWSKFLRVSGLATNDKKSAIFVGVGYDLETGRQIRGTHWAWNALYGQPLEPGNSGDVALGQGFAKKIDCVPSPPQKIRRSIDGYEARMRPFACRTGSLQFSTLTPKGQASAIDLNVSGLVDAGFRDLDSRFLMMPLDQAQSLYDTRDISYVSILLKNPGQAHAFAQNLQATLNARGLQVRVQPWTDHPVIGDTYKKTDDLLTTYRNFLILVLLGITGLSTLNTMVRIIRERTREIGSWRSIGYTQPQLIGIFAAEAFLLGAIGSLLGGIGAVLLSLVVNAMNILYRAGLFAEPVPLSIAFVPKNYLQSTLILILICMIASVWTTWQTVKKRIYENMVA